MGVPACQPPRLVVDSWPFPDNTKAPPPDKIAQFPGFDIPRQNWFKLSNDWSDLTAVMRSRAKHKIVEYVLRHTWGYQEYGGLKRITLHEFEHGRRRADRSRVDQGIGMRRQADRSRVDQGIGMRRQAIISGIRQAVEHGFLVEGVDGNDKARVKKYYGLKMLPHLNQGYENHSPWVWPSHSSGMETTQRTEKETIGGTNNKDVVVKALTKFQIGEPKAQELASRFSSDKIMLKKG